MQLLTDKLNTKLTHLDFTKMKSLANTTSTDVIQGFPQRFIKNVDLDLEQAFAIQLLKYGRATFYKLLTVPTE